MKGSWPTVWQSHRGALRILDLESSLPGAPGSNLKRHTLNPKRVLRVGGGGPVDPAFRAFSGRLKFTFRRHKFNKDSLFSAADVVPRSRGEQAFARIYTTK